MLTESQHLLSFALASSLPRRLAMTAPGLLAALAGVALFAWLLAFAPRPGVRLASQAAATGSPGSAG